MIALLALSLLSDTLRIHSTYLNQDRAAYVSLPPSHAKTTRAYPVVVVLDGEYNFDDAVTVTKELTSLGHFPEAIVVAIPNVSYDPRQRVYDMTPPGMSVSGSDRNQGGDKFLDFIEKELLPQITQKYRGGAPNILVGHSSGGVIVTHAAATRPSSFPVVIAIDAPITLDDEFLAKEFSHRGSSALRYVSLESRFGWTDKDWQDLTRRAPANWRLKREKLEGESHESMGFLSMYQGLKYAFADYSVVGAPLIPRGTAIGAFEHYAKFEKEFAAPLPPPQRALQRMVEDLLTEGNVTAAKRALRWLEEGYGDVAEKAELQRMIAASENLPPLKETVADLKATPMPSTQQIAPFVGTWNGHHWMNPAAKTPVTLRIAIENGKVVAETMDHPAPGVELKRIVEYMKVTPDGLEFGNMNGMRPMGMLVSEGKRSGDVLEGVIAFRGVRFPLPGEEAPPPIRFRLERSR